MIPAIDIEKLSVAFQSKTGATHALQELTLSVSPGIVFGFLGPNGAGKTTTIHVLLGFQAATSGTAKIFGQSVTDAVARHRIGYLSENPDAYSFLTGRELLTMAGNLFGLPPSEIKRRVNVLILETGLSFAADRRIASYSRGMRQRICMAQALINDPDLLILDEPTGGLDPLGRLEVRTLITSLKERGKTVFFSSHELSEVELICDRIAILANGRLLAEGPLGSIVPAGENLERFFTNTVTRRTDLAAPL
ncbi:MAG: ABC transporter ATP-binding protein [bacterium]